MTSQGQRWREKKSGRVVVVLEIEIRGIGPAWHYEDEAPEDWHYSCAEAFGAWGWFVLLPVLVVGSECRGT